MTGDEHATRVRPFLSNYERARLDGLSPGSKKRVKLLHRLCHGYEEALDWRLASGVVPGTPAEVARRMEARGAGSTCYVLCNVDEWDGREVPLIDALAALAGGGLPVLLVSGPVAYFEPEYVAGPAKRFILQRA